MINDLDDVDWPRLIKDMHAATGSAVAGRGAEVDFPILLGNVTESIRSVYTTRPDTLFGATYMVLASSICSSTGSRAKPNVRVSRNTSAGGGEQESSPRPHRSAGQARRPVFSLGPGNKSGQRPGDTRLDRRLRSDGLWRHRCDRGTSRRIDEPRLLSRVRGRLVCRSSAWSHRARRQADAPLEIAEPEPGTAGPFAKR